MILIDIARISPNLRQFEKHYSNVSLNLRSYSRWNIGTNLYNHLSWSNSSKTCQDNTTIDKFDNTEQSAPSRSVLTLSTSMVGTNPSGFPTVAVSSENCLNSVAPRGPAAHSSMSDLAASLGLMHCAGWLQEEVD